MHIITSLNNTNPITPPIETDSITNIINSNNMITNIVNNIINFLLVFFVSIKGGVFNATKGKAEA